MHIFNWFRSIRTNWLNSTVLFLFSGHCNMRTWVFRPLYGFACVCYRNTVQRWFRMTFTACHSRATNNCPANKLMWPHKSLHVVDSWEEEKVHFVSELCTTHTRKSSCIVLRQSTQYQNSMAGTTFSHLFLESNNSASVFFFLFTPISNRFMSFFLSDAQLVSWEINLTLNCVSAALAMCPFWLIDSRGPSIAHSIVHIGCMCVCVCQKHTRANWRKRRQKQHSVSGLCEGTFYSSDFEQVFTCTNHFLVLFFFFTVLLLLFDVYRSFHFDAYLKAC